MKYLENNRNVGKIEINENGIIKTKKYNEEIENKSVRKTKDTYAK